MHSKPIVFFVEKNFWSWREKYVTKDEYGDIVFRLISPPFSFGSNITLVQPDGTVVLRAEREIYSLQNKHKIYRSDAPIATLTKEILKLKPKYDIDVMGPDDYSVEGNIWGQDYVFLRNEQIIADVSNQGNFFGRRNYLRIEADEDHELILLCTMLIDLIKWRRRSK